MGSMVFANFRIVFRSPTAIVSMKSSMHVLIWSTQISNRLRNKIISTTLVNRDCSLKPLKCLIIGHARAGALVT